MRRKGVAALLTASALALAACGSAGPDADPGPASTPVPTTTGQTAEAAGLSPGGGDERPTSSRLPPDPTFPITVRRTGGVAGFDDTVVLQPDGRVSVDTHRLHGRVCTLDRGLRTRLYSSLRTIILGTTTATPSPTEASTGAPASTGGPGSAGATGSAEGSTTGPGAAVGDETSDPITIALTDVHDRVLDLSDPSLGAVASLVDGLVQDVTVTSPGSATCVTSTAAAG